MDTDSAARVERIDTPNSNTCTNDSFMIMDGLASQKEAQQGEAQTPNPRKLAQTVRHEEKNKTTMGIQGRSPRFRANSSVATASTKWEVVTCNVCKKAFGDRAQLIEHMPVHTDSKPFKCELCARLLPTKLKLNRHVKTHTKPRRFMCYVCNYGFIQILHFRRHIATSSHLKACTAENIDPEGNLAEYVAAFEEDRFTKTFVSVGKLDTSINGCGKVEIKTTDDVQQDRKKIDTEFLLSKEVTAEEHDKRFVCEQCGSSFKRKSHLTRHIQTHGERLYICETCGQGFTTSTTLGHHIRIHKDPVFACEYCDRRFRTHQGKKNHVIQTHNDKTPKQWHVSTCAICNKSFGTKRQLTQHTAAAHKGNKPFKCDRCSKSFPTKGTLNSHSKRHTQNRRYMCYVCNSGFFGLSKLRRHMETSSHLQACKDVNINPEGNLADYLSAFEEDRFTKMVVSVGNIDSSQKPTSSTSGTTSHQLDVIVAHAPHLN